MLVQRTSPATGTPDWNPNWRTDPNISGGGILVDHGPHCIYLTEWLTGQRIQRAACEMKYALPGVEDHVELDLTLEGHAAAHILLTWRGSHRSTSYQLIGTKGMATLTGDTVEVDGRLGRQTWRNSETPGTLHAHDDWLPAQAPRSSAASRPAPKTRLSRNRRWSWRKLSRRPVADRHYPALFDTIFAEPGSRPCSAASVCRE